MQCTSYRFEILLQVKDCCKTYLWFETYSAKQIHHVL